MVGQPICCTGKTGADPAKQVQQGAVDHILQIKCGAGQTHFLQQGNKSCQQAAYGKGDGCALQVFHTEVGNGQVM